MQVFNFIRGSIATLLIIINMLVHATLTLIFGLLLWPILNNTKVSACAQSFVLQIPRSWSYFNFMIFQMSSFGKWDIQGNVTLSRDQWYILVSNHQSWVDILILGGFFCNKIPPIKFFMKKELLWTLPIAGLCCYLLGYPMMERHSRADIRKNPALKGKDIETTKAACQKFKLLPTTVINFVEGTRFTQAKHDKQGAPFKHLLKPKAAGTAIVINEMVDCLAGILNVTVNYDIEKITFFNILSGNFKKISLRYELLPIPEDVLGNYFEDRQYRSRFQRWLNNLWEGKDQLLDELDNNA